MEKSYPFSYLKVIVSFLLLFALNPSFGQTMMPLPAHASVYTGNVRGYWFTAPVNFTITGLRVAAQAGTGLQYIHVFKINDPVPVVYSVSSTNFTTLAYIQGAPNNVIQTVNINVVAGDKIAIMGQAGTGNSYGTVAGPTTIAGNNVTLARILYQGTLVSGPAPNYSTEPTSSSISRVEMYYQTGPPCPAPTGLAASGVTMNSANMNWSAVTGSTGYEYALTTTATPPASGTAIATNSYNATGLNGGTNYWFHVRNACSATNFSQWVTTPFSTLACPSSGTPVVTVNTPGTVTFSWPGSTNPGVASYQYAVTTSATAPGTWSSTAASTVTVNGLTPGVTYYAHVRSHCATSNSHSPWLNVQFFNPFPPCFAPGALGASNVNMHGATLTWVSGVNGIGYQYAVTTSATPPATGTPTTDTVVDVTNLTAGTLYYAHIRTHCGTTNYSPWLTDTFSTPLSCLPPIVPIVSNVTTSTAEIRWNYYPGIYGYEYFVNTSPATPTFTGIPVNYNVYFPASLSSGTTYYIHLRTRCDSANYSPWTVASFTTETNCSAPSTPAITSLSSDQASFSWSAVITAASYEYAITTSAVPPSFGAFTSLTNYTATSLVSGTNYYFHLRAYCSESDRSAWKTVNFVPLPTGVNNVNGNDKFTLEAYPNPVSDILHVKVTGKQGTTARMQLVDISGKIIQTILVEGNTAEVNTASMAAGMYLLRYVDSENAGVIRIEKQ